MLDIRRREFITLIGGAAVALPLATRAQQPASARLGVLLYSNPTADPQMRAVLRALGDLGYVEGRNIDITYRYAEGNAERLPDLASELVRLKPDVILALGGDVAPMAKKATPSIPIVFLSSADPQQLGLVASLGRPGGNATGVTLVADELASKRLEILKEAAPRISEVAFIWNPDHPDNEQREAQRAAQALGVRLHPIAVRGTSDFDAGLSAAHAVSADALYVVSSRHTALNIARIVDFATRTRLPLAGGWGTWAKQGGLLSYGPDLGTMARRGAAHIDKILRGAKPADLPVEQPTKFELVVNLKTAKALGLEIPPTLLARADEVIE
ncbi:MAG: ABC transporter substrate-binding protein [Xanthobacteraceae bacterium]